MRFIRNNWGLLLGLTVFFLIVGVGTYELLQRNPGTPDTVSGTIAFRSDRDTEIEIYTWTLDERKSNRLTRRPGREAHPAYSHDGRALAFDIFNNGQTDIFVADAVNGVGSTLVIHPANDTQPAWDPKGGRLAFVSDRSGTLSVYTITQDRNTLVRLTGDEGNDTNPAWSPNGNEIVFASDRDGTQNLYRLDVTSCQPSDPTEDRPYPVAACNITPLTADTAANTEPHWSPDGRQVLFTSTREGGQAIYAMTLRNGRVERLTSGSQDSEAKWSPDGNRISYTSRQDGNAEIYVLDIGRNQLERLTNNPAEDTHSAWRPPPPTN
jgi:Tol biopolymer transport system component